MARRNVRNMQEDAEALDDLADGMEVLTQDDIVTGDVKTQVRDMGMGAAPIKVTNNADQMVALYHVMDGRVVRVPMYMVPKMLTHRFPSETDIPASFHRKRVWSVRRDDAPPEVVRPFLCPLSKWQNDEQKALMTKAGLPSNCMKRGTFATQFEADEHFRMKHRRRWAAYQRYLDEARSRESQDNMTRLIEAMLASRAQEE